MPQLRTAGDNRNADVVYQVIGYYLKHSDELAGYFEARTREEEGLLSSHPEWSPKGLRDRLLARQGNQTGLAA